MTNSTFVVSVNVADVRLSPDAAAELVTQALMNVAARAGESRDGWTHVTLSDYEGWIRSDQLEEAIPPVICREGETHLPARPLLALVTTTHAPLYADATGIEAMGCVYLSTALPLLDTTRGERVRVALPGKRSGWLERATIAVRQPEAIYTAQPTRVVTDYARQFLGVAYLWGGTGWQGIDCSGLVQLCHRMGGSILPRDADQQHDFLSHVVARSEIQEGDLIFFGSKAITHVALALNHDEYIHAEGQNYNRVVINSFRPQNEHYYPRLDEIVWGVRRVMA